MTHIAITKEQFQTLYKFLNEVPAKYSRTPLTLLDKGVGVTIEEAKEEEENSKQVE